jgi:VanZ family protein
MTRTRIPRLVCALVLCGILVAGLTPFRRPRNAVTWLGKQNGLHFGRYGTVWSSGELQAAAAQNEPECSLEISLQPSIASASSTVLAFYTPQSPLHLSLHQYRTVFIVIREIPNDPKPRQVIGIADVLRPTKPAFVAVTSGPQKTSIYVDGNLKKQFPLFRMGGDCTGQLVAGTSPVENNSWSGDIRALAIYQRELTPAEVLQHFETWTSQGRPLISPDDNPMAVYLFDERAGNIVHDITHHGIDLYIPTHFSLLRQRFLEPFWEEFKPKRDYWADIAVNVAGFIPLGLVFFAYWSSVRPIKHPVVATVALGLAVSLTIEVLQSYLPTRDSGTTDLITNTLGTFVGVKIYSLRSVRALLAKIF